MADIPISLAAPAATLAVTAIGTLFGLLIRSKGSEAKAWKSAYKDVVASRRRIRRDVERAQLGAPSVPPIDDSDYDDQTARINAIDREDSEWRPPTHIDATPLRRPAIEALEDRLSREEREKNDVDRRLRKFVADGESTPPEPPFRRKLPSRRG